MSENVNHPKHYTTGKIEVIEFIEDQGFGPGFCMGNAIKYAARAGKKDPTKEIEDLEKAQWYLKRRIETLKAAKEGREPVRPNDMNPRACVHSENKWAPLCECGHAHLRHVVKGVVGNNETLPCAITGCPCLNYTKDVSVDEHGGRDIASRYP